jgi:hypothetical protein
MLRNKTSLLLLSIFMDFIGYLSYSIFGLGETIDFIWAPLSAYIFYKMYPGTEGKVGSFVTFVEEIIPFTDLVPTFTIMWVYKFIIKREKTNES